MFGLNLFDPKQRVYIDCETTSFNDELAALNPYRGDKITTIIIGQVGKPTMPYPVRNRNPKQPLLDIEKFYKEFREWCAEVLLYANLNIKFDLRFMACEDIYFPKAVFEDTGVLARLVNNQETGFDLDNLTKVHGCEHKKLKHLIQPYLQNSKDYGRIPTDILNQYGCGDVDGNIDLHEKLLIKLPEESHKVWDVEKRFCRQLINLEHRGIPINTPWLQKREQRLVVEMLLLAIKIKTLTKGRIDNPKSPAQVAAYFHSEGIEPVVFNEPTDKMRAEGKMVGNPSWNADALEQINHPVATLLIDYGERHIQAGTFCKGWVNASDSNGRVHPDFKSNGTKTGRPSSAEPNVYNPPKWLMEAITIPPGMVGVKWDKSQIEYRLFAHYANDQELLAQYKANPRIDYHQILADRLGIPRDPTKNVNFGMLYGMGEKKLKRKLAALFGELDRGDKLTAEGKIKLRKIIARYVGMSGKDPDNKIIVLDVGPIDPRAFVFAAEAILVEYHSKVPAVRQMQKRVKDVVIHRGYVKNFFGRRYYYKPEIAYIALNAIIQGTAADFFKLKLCELFEACDQRVEMVNMIYDSCFAVMPIECAQSYWDLCQKVVCDAPFNVPVLIDGEVALGHWGNITKIKNNDVLATAGTICKLKIK